MQQLTEIRPATLDDLNELLSIRQDPKVAEFHYRYSDEDKLFREVIECGKYKNAEDVRLTTLLCSDSIVGYIFHSHASTEENVVAACGWSLHPKFWGLGIMTKGMKLLLSQFFDAESHTHVYATCFVSNKRCIRLLKRLRFERWNYPIGYRIACMYRARSLRWEHMYGMTAERWSSSMEKQ